MARTRRVVQPPAPEVSTTPGHPASGRGPTPIALTVKACARLYSLSPDAIRGMIHRGRLPAARPPGTRDYIIRVEDIERVLAPQFYAPPPREETEDERIDRVQRAAGIA